MGLKFKTSFDKRLLSYLLGLLGIFMLFSLVFQYSREKEYRAELLNSDLVLLNAQAYSYIQEGGDIHDFLKLFKPSAIENIRLTVLDTCGNVISDDFYPEDFDESLHSVQYENHSDRPEIKEALKFGTGYTSSRLSSTTNEEYFYSASLIGDRIIRTAVPYNNSLRDILKADRKLYWFMLVYVILISMIFYYIIMKLSMNASAQKELEKSQLKKELTQNIGHELRTPVGGITGYLETIMSVPDLPEEKKDMFIKKSYELSLRLTRILQDTSLITRMDEGKELIDFENLFLREIIEECIYEAEGKLKEKGIKVETKFEEFTPINGNYTLLHSIFSNLIDNAISYSGGNLIYISVEKMRHFPYHERNYYKVCFKDNGVGIDKEHIGKIFERFYRIDKGRSRKLGGTGLGLSIVKNAVLLHKGIIKARKSDLGGVEFVFTLAVR